MQIKKNWDEKVDKIRTILSKWSKRDLSLFGKVQIIKSLALSQITLSASTLPVPDGIVKNINTIFHKFIWGSHDRVKRVKIIKPVQEGGLKMIDLDSYFKAIKASWICKILTADPNEETWAQLPYLYFKDFFACNTTLRLNFDDNVTFSDMNVPDFYREVIQAYNMAFNYDKKTFVNNIQTQLLWGNKFLTYSKLKGKKKDVLFLRNWIRSGIIHISDLKFLNGNLDETYLYNKTSWSYPFHWVSLI